MEEDAFFLVEVVDRGESGSGSEAHVAAGSPDFAAVPEGLVDLLFVYVDFELVYGPFEVAGELSVLDDHLELGRRHAPVGGKLFEVFLPEEQHQEAVEIHGLDLVGLEKLGECVGVHGSRDCLQVQVADHGAQSQAAVLRGAAERLEHAPLLRQLHEGRQAQQAGSVLQPGQPLFQALACISSVESRVVGG